MGGIDSKGRIDLLTGLALSFNLIRINYFNYHIGGFKISIEEKERKDKNE